MASFISSYRTLLEEGELKNRVQAAYLTLTHCTGCAWKCGADRLHGKKGACLTGLRAQVSSYGPHHGEENPLSGWRGSGTIFFTRCNLRCQYCQNYDISQGKDSEEIEPEDLAEIMLELQEMGCHNINLVSPSHVVPQIIAATSIAAMAGLNLPIVFNTGGYDSLEALNLLNGIIDIYMPDMKYMDPDKAAKYSAGASDYPELTKKAIIEMNRQVGELQIDKKGIAFRGVIIRHLVMPNRVAGTEKFVKWVAEALPKSTYLNIMPQYRVEYKAYEYPEIARGITVQEFLEAMDWAKKYGLTNLDPNSVAVRDFYLQRESDRVPFKGD